VIGEYALQPLVLSIVDETNLENGGSAWRSRGGNGRLWERGLKLHPRVEKDPKDREGLASSSRPYSLYPRMIMRLYALV
jgi:hypothetical protein